MVIGDERGSVPKREEAVVDGFGAASSEAGAIV